MNTHLNQTAAHWNQQTELSRQQNPGISWWEAGDAINEFTNRRISGDPGIDWISYTLETYFWEKQHHVLKHLSLGCGSGHVERSIAHKAPYQCIDAYDVAKGSIEIAREEAQKAGLDNLNYYVTNINEIQLPANTYDVVWIHAAMHHFEALEHICRQIAHALKPEGILVLQEYIGPNRFQFPVRQKEIANLCLKLLPKNHRIMVPQMMKQEVERLSADRGINWYAAKLTDKIKDGDLIGALQRQLNYRVGKGKGRALQQDTITFPTERSVMSIDPSEAIRSSDIVPVLKQQFDIIEKKDWGGNILQFLLHGIAGNFANEDAHSKLLLKMLINIEETLLECGEYTSDFAYIVARPRI